MIPRLFFGLLSKNNWFVLFVFFVTSGERYEYANEMYILFTSQYPIFLRILN